MRHRKAHQTDKHTKGMATQFGRVQDLVQSTMREKRAGAKAGGLWVNCLRSERKDWLGLADHKYLLLAPNRVVKRQSNDVQTQTQTHIKQELFVWSPPAFITLAGRKEHSFGFSIVGGVETTGPRILCRLCAAD